MSRKIFWPSSTVKGNPFGGVDGHRPITITFHDTSFKNLPTDEKASLDILIGLSDLENINAMSFNGLIMPKINIDFGDDEDELIKISVLSDNGNAIKYTGIHKNNIEPHYILKIAGVYSKNNDKKNQHILQELTIAKTNNRLKRDLLVTYSDVLLQHRDKFQEINIFTPKEALKIVSLYLRMRGDFEWVSHITENVRHLTSRDAFYNLLAQGYLLDNWNFFSGLHFHNAHDKLVQFGWNLIERLSRTLQALDEMARLYYLSNVVNTNDQMLYHFDYFNLLLTSIFDIRASIMNELFCLGLEQTSLAIQRKDFQKKLKGNRPDIFLLITSNKSFTDILFALRNKIHSTSIEIDKYVPTTYPEKLLNDIYNFSPNWGVQKKEVTLIENNNPPIQSINYSVNLFMLSKNIFTEFITFLNSLLKETNIEKYLRPEDILDIKTAPPDEDLIYISIYKLLF